MSIEAKQRPYRYDIVADYYDLHYVDKAPRDVDFYLETAAQCGGTVLELGCGTGRVTLPLARAGHSVVALDLSTAMLGVLRGKLELEPAEVRARVELVEGDMASFELGRRFALVIAPFRAFQHLLTPELQRSCLTHIHEHLADGGRFVYNAFNPGVEYIADAARRGAAWKYDLDGEDASGSTNGRLVRRAYYANPDPVRQVHDLWFRYEEYEAGELKRTRIENLPLRWQWRWEAEYLLELCRFELEAAYADYQRTPLDEKFGELIFVCRRGTET